MQKSILNKITVRVANKKDAEELIALFNQITSSIKKKGGKWANYKVESEHKLQKKIIVEIVNSQSKIFIAQHQGKIVGAVNLQIIPNIRHGWHRGHLEEVIVKEGFRGKKIGTTLIQSVKKYCQTNNIKSIKLLCGNQLKDSQKFYRKNKFKFTDKGYRFELK